MQRLCGVHYSSIRKRLDLIGQDWTGLDRIGQDWERLHKIRLTDLCISVDPRPRPHGLETRVNIKNSTHPCSSRTFDCFSWGSAKKNSEKNANMAHSKKPCFSKQSFLNCIVLQNWAGLVLGSVGLIDAKCINVNQPIWLGFPR